MNKLKGIVRKFGHVGFENAEFILKTSVIENLKEEIVVLLKNSLHHSLPITFFFVNKALFDSTTNSHYFLSSPIPNLLKVPFNLQEIKLSSS
jgi:hypothetical protein